MPRLALPAPLLRTVARQLGGPSGPLGALVARGLNKGNRSAITAAVETLELSGTETVADVGFGGGLGLALLLAAAPDGRVHGVEPSRDMIGRARRQHRGELDAGRLELHEGTLQGLPFADGFLDGWISINTIYFVPDLAPAFRELARVLAPGGRGVLGVADPDWMAGLPFVEHGFTVRRVTDVVGSLEEAGLSVERRTLGERAPYNLLVCSH